MDQEAALFWPRREAQLSTERRRSGKSVRKKEEGRGVESALKTTENRTTGKKG